jgi:hypothetical protein
MPADFFGMVRQPPSQAASLSRPLHGQEMSQSEPQKENIARNISKHVMFLRRMVDGLVFPIDLRGVREHHRERHFLKFILLMGRKTFLDLRAITFLKRSAIK